MSEQDTHEERSALGTKDIDRFRQDGYLHIRGVFTSAEIGDLRRHVLATEEERLRSGGSRSFMHADPRLANLIFDDRILGIARQILGQVPSYFGESKYTIFPKDSSPGGLHKDNADRVNRGPDWSGQYPLIQFAVYLQDHSKASGGLAVCRGSHLSVARHERTGIIKENMIGPLTGRTRYLHSQVGDLVVWNLRTTHAGFCHYVRMLPWMPITSSPPLWRHVPTWLLSKAEQTRATLFVTYGLRGSHLDRYVKAMLVRPYAVEMWKNSPYTQKLLAKAAEKPIEIIDLPSEVARLETAGIPIGNCLEYHDIGDLDSEVKRLGAAGVHFD